MKKTIKDRKPDQTRVLNAHELPRIVGGKVLDNPAYEVASVVGNNPLYEASAASNNPLYKG